MIEVWERESTNYLKPIINEIDKHGGPIDKVRAGYLLEEVVGINDQTIHSWLSYSMRGGSRKLDPEQEYAPRWSEKWCLSLNV